ncbi:hypothetical protein GIB67_008125 [Kingdonia uniflora]|uniref:Cytochrome P450 n=1 Tax=Kingdonia uniflora TaxID=39325 RepID=A0A7J7MSX8_9MAGN|nr:hypothetical protein GIB67_008125 [Kingdonia uniflora]
MELKLPHICFAFLCVFFAGWYFKHKSLPITHWPLIGMLPTIVPNTNRLPEWFNDVFSSTGCGSFFIYGPVFSKLCYLVTCHPKNIEYILKTNFGNYPKGPDYGILFEILGDGIFKADYEFWRLQRKMVHSCLSSIDFRTLVAETCHKLVYYRLVPLLSHAAKEGVVVDIQDVILRYFFDSNTSTILGGDEGYLSKDLPKNELATALDEAQEAILIRHTKPMFLWKTLRWLNIGREKQLSKAWITIDALLGEYISQRRESIRIDVPRKRPDLLSTFILDSSENDKFMRDTVLSMFVAGLDTTTSGLIWFFWLVSRTPRVEAKILDELKLLLSKKGNPVNNRPHVFDPKDLKVLVYLHAALCESLRLNAPLPMNSKAVKKEDILPDGTVVKPGMQIIISFYSEGKMQWIWGKDSMEFKPERWIDNEGKFNNELMSNLFVFNTGPRSCLGKEIAFTQMKSAVAAILFNFHLEVVEGQDFGLRPFLNLLLQNGLKVRIKERVI